MQIWRIHFFSRYTQLRFNFLLEERFFFFSFVHSNLLFINYHLNFLDPQYIRSFIPFIHYFFQISLFFIQRLFITWIYIRVLFQKYASRRKTSFENSIPLLILESIKFKSTIAPGAGTKKICRFTRDERVTREEEEVGEELLQRRVSKREGERKEEEGRLRYKLSRSHAIPTYSSSTATE